MDYMEYLTKLQNDYKFLKDMLKSLEKQKKTPGNGFAKMKCRELIATYKDCIKEAKLILEI